MLNTTPKRPHCCSAAEAEEIRGSYRIALLVALSCVLQISESLIPHPIPGLRLGLANLVTLVALILMGFRPALEIALLRTLLSSLIMGTFMSPTFILSFCGAVVSTLVMGLLFQVSRYHHRFGFSIIGISIVGALAHNLVQLYLAYLLLVRHGGIFVFFPWLCYGAVGMGWITGAVAAGVCRRLALNAPRKPSTMDFPHENEGVFSTTHFQPHTGFLHRMPAEIKLAGILLLALLVLVFSHLTLFLVLFCFLSLLVLAAGISPGFLLRHVRRYQILILMAFLLPLFFNAGDQILFQRGFFTITQEGVTQGALFGLRILFLILMSALLMRTTSPEHLTRGLSRILMPLKYVGISERRTAGILSLSWTAVPVLWDTARHSLRRSDISRTTHLRNLIPALSDFIAGMFAETDPESVLWNRTRAGEKTPPAKPETEEPTVPR